MVTNLFCLYASLAVMNAVIAQNSTENNTSLQWLNNLLLVPSVEMKNELLAANGNAVNLNPEEVAQTACVDKNSRQGVCVMHYQCQPISRSLIKDGATILDVRENEGACPNVLEVCCMNILVTKDNSVVGYSKKENTHSSAVRNKGNILSFIIALQFYQRIFNRISVKES